MAKEIKFKIIAVNAMKRPVAAVKRGFKSLAAASIVTAGIMRRAFLAVTRTIDRLARAAIIPLVGAFTFLGASIKEAFKRERFEVQLETLLGSLSEAKKRLKDLVEFSDRTPFELDEMVEANRILETFTEGAFDAIDMLTKMGDAASANDKPIADVADAFGKFVSRVKGGKKVGEELVEPLQTLGIVAGSAAVELKKLAGDEAIGFVIKQMDKFKGGMDRMSKTGEGLMSTLKQKWKNILQDFGLAFMGLTKDGIGGLIKRLNDLQKSGAVTRFAEKAAKALRKVAVVVGDLFSADASVRAAAMDTVSKKFAEISVGFATTVAQKLEEKAPAIGRGIARGMADFGKESARAVAESAKKAPLGFASKTARVLTAGVTGDPFGLNQKIIMELSGIKKAQIKQLEFYKSIVE